MGKSLLIALLVWLAFPVVEVSAQSADYGAVHGVVLRYDGTPLPGGEVELSSREEDFAVQVAPDGTFSLHARPGVYSLKVTQPEILPFQRAQVVLRAGSVIHLNIRPVFAHPDPGLHYFSFGVPGPLQLGAVMRRVDRVRPTGLNHFDQDYAMLSYDTLSVYARTLDCDRRTLRCQADGDVWIEMNTDTGVRTERAPRCKFNSPSASSS
jgi:hypothetical protein